MILKCFQVYCSVNLVSYFDKHKYQISSGCVHKDIAIANDCKVSWLKDGSLKPLFCYSGFVNVDVKQL